MATSLALASPVLVLCILLGAAAIFFLLPRVSAGYLGAYAPGGEISTGFSDTVELGRIGEIQQSGSVVMHIQIDGDDRGSFDLKWRGIALSNFDGRDLVEQSGPASAVSRTGRSFRVAAGPPTVPAGLSPSDSLPGVDGAGGHERLFPGRARRRVWKATTNMWRWTMAAQFSIWTRNIQ